jgi:hypothetical protein
VTHDIIAAGRVDRAAIEQECQNAAASDWEKWQRDTAIYREALQAKIDGLRIFEPPVSP